MNAKTLKALRDSIAHWERMASGKRKADECHFSDSCALCKMFLHGAESECSGCPVAEATGATGCKASATWLACEDAYCSGPECEEYDTPAFKAAARKQLAFLKSLLPKGNKKK